VAASRPPHVGVRPIAAIHSAVKRTFAPNRDGSLPEARRAAAATCGTGLPAEALTKSGVNGLIEALKKIREGMVR